MKRVGARSVERGRARERGGVGVCLAVLRTWRCLSWDWGLAYQQPTRARVSRVYVLEVGQSLYGFQSHQLPSVRDRVRIRFVVPS